MFERENLQLLKREVHGSVLQRARRNFEEVRRALNTGHEHFTFSQVETVKVAWKVRDVLARRWIVAKVVLREVQMAKVGVGRANEVAQLFGVRR